VIDIDDIRIRYRQAADFLDERGRRLFAANEALALGYGGVTATSVAGFAVVVAGARARWRFSLACRPRSRP
jgi:hypothetical protein